VVTILKQPDVKAELEPLLKTIQMAGHETPFGVIDGIDVVAKTGTLDFVSALAGYVEGPKGTMDAFAILCADVPARNRAKAEGKEVPVGARTYRSRARIFQRDVLSRWVSAHSL